MANGAYKICQSMGRASIIALMLMLLGTWFSMSLSAQERSGVSYAQITTNALKNHYGEYSRRLAQSFEGKDLSPEDYGSWPKILLQTTQKTFDGKDFTYTDEYDTRISENWSFLDYQISYARMRGIQDNRLKSKILSNLATARIIDYSIPIYWQAIAVERYGKAIEIQQERINKILRGSRLSNIVNPLLPHEERQLLDTRNKIISTLNLLEQSNKKFNQFIGYRRDINIAPLAITLPVSYYNGQQLDQAVFRSFEPFKKLQGEAKEYATEDKAYSEIGRLFPSVRFDVGENTYRTPRRDIVRWHNYGTQLGWNLSNIFKTYPINKTGMTREHARASSMAMVARNRIALVEYQQNLINFNTALLAYNNTLWAQANTSIYGDDSVESITVQVEKIIAAVRSSYAYASLQQSYFRLLMSGGYLMVDNINPADGQRKLENAIQITVQRSLIGNAIALGNRLDRSLLNEHADQPEVLKVLHAWQQTLTLVLATNHGRQRVSAETSLPRLADNAQTNGLAANTTDGLVAVAGALPRYRKPAKVSEVAASIERLGTSISRHRRTIEEIESLRRVVDGADSTVQDLDKTATRTERFVNRAVGTVDSLQESSKRSLEAANAAQDSALSVRRSTKDLRRAAQTIDSKADIINNLLIPETHYPSVPTSNEDAKESIKMLRDEQESMKIELNKDKSSSHELEQQEEARALEALRKSRRKDSADSPAIPEAN